MTGLDGLAGGSGAALWMGVVAASLVGSLHCAGMCGAFVSLACGLDNGSRGRGVARLSLYHVGRLMGYAALGAAAGGVGSVVDLGSRAAGLGRVAAIVGAVSMLAIAALMLIPGLWKPHQAKAPGVLQHAFRKGVGVAQVLPADARAWLIGALAVLLPCGWLYAFAVVAASTASPLGGAMVMGAFWVGTVPVLSTLGLGVRELRGKLGGWIRPISGVALLLVGGVTLVGASQVSDEQIQTMLTSLEASGGVEGDCPLCEGTEP